MTDLHGAARRQSGGVSAGVPAEAPALLAQAGALLAADFEPGLALLEQGYQRFPDWRDGKAPVFARAYVQAVLARAAGFPFGQRFRAPLHQAVIGFMERHPALIRQDYLWLDRLLRVDRNLCLPIRRRLWSLALETPPRGLEPALSVLVHAHGTRDLAVMAQAAALLRAALLAPGREASPPDLPHWALAGDAFLLNDAPEEAEACYRAALALGPGHPRGIMGLAALALDRDAPESAGRLVSEGAGALRAAGDEEAARIAEAVAALWSRRAAAPPPETVEIVFFCHATAKLKRNPHLGPPGTGLMDTALASLRAEMRPGPEVPATLLYDHRDTPLNDEFRAGLERLCAAEGMRLVVNTGNGLRRQWLDAFSRARADLVMVVEQDHEFLPPCPSFPQLLATFAARPDINHLRINRRDNLPAGFDMMLSRTARDAESGILRTGRFSNTPHVIRRDFYEAVVHPIIVGRDTQDARNMGAAGVEESVNAVMRRMEGLVGLPALMRLFGLAIWGHPGERQRVRHLGL